MNTPTVKGAMSVFFKMKNWLKFIKCVIEGFEAFEVSYNREFGDEKKQPEN